MNDTCIYNVLNFFCLQGQQSFDMGRTLYKEEPVFRKAVDECDYYYQKLTGKSFLRTYNLFIELDPSKTYNPDIVNEIQVSQPAILFLQVCSLSFLAHTIKIPFRRAIKAG